MMEKHFVIVKDVYGDTLTTLVLKIENLVELPNNPTIEEVAQHYAEEKLGKRLSGDFMWDSVECWRLDETKDITVPEDLLVGEKNG